MRSIHLLYVPTLSCNLRCTYCYLGEQTNPDGLRIDARRAVNTLRHALGAFEAAGVLPFNVSLHGGEVTMLPPPVLEGLFELIRSHYVRHFDAISALGHRKSSPHIKTNLYRFGQLYDLLVRCQVSVSASVDLPLALHERHRRTRGGRSWLERTEANLRLLAGYPHSKKISATLSAEHLKDLPVLVDGIWYLHRELGFDMNQFNVMFAFPSALNLADHAMETLPPATPTDQLALYEALTDEFTGTELEYGLRRNWFDEFTPNYCTNMQNCGERFFLLQSDGSVYSCVRGQGLPEFCYGNIFTDSVDAILAKGVAAVSTVHQRHGFDDECRSCGYLSLCNTGCPVVKLQLGSGRSYTCDIQRSIYRDYPLTYPRADHAAQQEYAREYQLQVHPELLTTGGPPDPQQHAVLLPAGLIEENNSLCSLVESDPVLTQLYRDDAWVLRLGRQWIPLSSQLTKTESSCYTMLGSDRVVVHLRRELWQVACSEPVRNTLYLQLLRDTPLVYGDDRRAKQEHLLTYQLYSRCCSDSELGPDWVAADITGLLEGHQHLFQHSVRNNLFVTTSCMRDYHYQKQKENAFYHIQAMNLPFQNFEFHYLPGGQS
jgi:uncharacterized protein